MTNYFYACFYVNNNFIGALFDSDPFDSPEDWPPGSVLMNSRTITKEQFEKSCNHMDKKTEQA